MLLSEPSSLPGPGTHGGGQGRTQNSSTEAEGWGGQAAARERRRVGVAEGAGEPGGLGTQGQLLGCGAVAEATG